MKSHFIILREGKEIPVEVEERQGGYRVDLDGTAYRVDSLEVRPSVYSILVENASYEVIVHRPGPDLFHIHLHDGMRAVELVHPMAQLLKKMGGGGGGGAAGSLKAPMPGKVVRVLVAPGDAVEKGAGLVVLEAMKMQNQLQAPGPGIVAEVRVGEGESVDGGQVLVILTPDPEAT